MGRRTREGERWGGKENKQKKEEEKKVKERGNEEK